MRGMIRAQRRIYAEWARGREGTLKEKMLAVTADALVVGADIAKLWQRARFALFRGLEHGKALKFKNRKDGFDEPSGTDQGLAPKGRLCKGCSGHGAGGTLLEAHVQLARKAGWNRGCDREHLRL